MGKPGWEVWRLRLFISLEVTPIYGVKGNESHNIRFLSPEWMEMFRYTQEVGKTNGIDIDMNTGTGWPFGGPEVSLSQAAAKAIFECYEVKGGEPVKLEINIRDPKEQKQRDGGENSSHPEGGGEDGHDNAVQKSFGVEHGWIAGQAVLKGADDGHGSHADGESGHDEAVDEFGVFFPAGFLSKPVPEFHKSFFNVHPLTNDGAQSQGHGAHHGAAGGQRAAVNGQHLFQGAGDSDEDDCEADGLHDRVLKSLGQSFLKQDSDNASGDDGAGVGNGSDSNHVKIPPVQVLTVGRTVTGRRHRRWKCQRKYSLCTDKILPCPRNP